MKITMIHGQNHKGSTYHIGRMLAEELETEENITTPNYCMASSGPLKAFIDLFYQYWIPHRPRRSMFSKKAVVISTTAGTGAGHAIKTVKRMLAYWGVPYIKTYGVVVQASCWADITEKRKAKIKKDMLALAGKVKGASSGKPSPYIRFLFHMMVLSRKNGVGDLPSETRYWKENGWMDGGVPWKNKK